MFDIITTDCSYIFFVRVCITVPGDSKKTLIPALFKMSVPLQLFSLSVKGAREQFCLRARAPPDSVLRPLRPESGRRATVSVIALKAIKQSERFRLALFDRRQRDYGKACSGVTS